MVVAVVAGVSAQCSETCLMQAREGITFSSVFEFEDGEFFRTACENYRARKGWTGTGAAGTTSVGRSGRTVRLGVRAVAVCNWWAAATPPPIAGDMPRESGPADAVATRRMVKMERIEVFMDG